MGDSLEIKGTKPKEAPKPAEQNVDAQAVGAKAEMTSLLGSGASACDAVSGCAKQKELMRVIDDPETHTRTVLDSKGRPLFSHVLGKPVEVSEDDEEEVDVEDYYTERENDAQLTPEKYLQILAQQLNTPEKLHEFLQEYMEYTSDPEVKAGTDSWCTAEETVQRVKDGKMIGDCDDYAFLAQKILNLQGHNAIVVALPMHGTCMWVEKKGKKYFGYSVGSEPLGKEEDDSLEGVLNKLLKKYQHPLKFDETSQRYVDDPSGKPYTVQDKKITVGVVGDWRPRPIDLPIEIIENPELYSLLVESLTGIKGKSQHLDAIELFDRGEELMGLLKDNPKMAEYVSSLNSRSFNGGARYSSLIRIGEAAMKRKDFVMAEKVFRKGISSTLYEAKDYDVNFMLMDCLNKSGKMKEAEMELDGLLQQKKDVSLEAFAYMVSLMEEIVEDGGVGCNKSFLDKLYKSIGDPRGAGKMYASCLFALGYEKEARTILKALIVTDDAKRITKKLIRGSDKTD